MRGEVIDYVDERAGEQKADRCPQGDLWEAYGRLGLGSDTEEELIQKYIPLVKSIAGRLAISLPSSVVVDDIESAGLLGLLDAVRRYRPDAGTSFESYARIRIRGAIYDELRRMDWVPRSVHDTARKVEKAIQAVEAERVGPAPEEEVAKALGLSLREYETVLEQIRPATFVSLDSCISGQESDESASLKECISDPCQPEPYEYSQNREARELILERLKDLPELQRKVMALYYNEGLRLKEIAAAVNLSESRICQIHSQAVLSIRSFLRKFGYVFKQN